MRGPWLALFVCCICLLSCKKEPKIDTVTYEVILKNASTWDGHYVDEKATIWQISNVPTNWKLSFKNTNGLKALMLGAKPNSQNDNADATMNIYINDKLYVTGTYKLNTYLLVDYPQP